VMGSVCTCTSPLAIEFVILFPKKTKKTVVDVIQLWNGLFPFPRRW
jgi:hypothetical protein